MKASLAAATLLAANLSPLPALATDVGVSVRVSQPGVYGRIDIGRFPQPQIIFPQPVIIAPPPPPPRMVVVAPPPPVQPVYMWVPPGHRKNWRKHCYRYGACGTPVYFVEDHWYGEHVHPRGKGKGKGKGRGRDHDDD